MGTLRMEVTRTIILLSIGISLLVIPGSAFRCYECIGCNDDFQSSEATTTECSSVCVKFKNKDTGEVIRACSPSSVPIECRDKEGLRGCSCDTDLCNGSTTLRISTCSFLVSAFITLYKLL